MKSNATVPENIFRCDCVKLKRAIQAKIYEETKYMSSKEVQERLRLAGERFDMEIESRRKEITERRDA
jgi:hypothetical protein